MERKGNDTYTTTSIDLASYLLSSGAHLTDITGMPPESTFVFEGISPEVISAYWSGVAKVNPQALLQAYKHLQHRSRELAGGGAR